MTDLHALLSHAMEMCICRTNEQIILKPGNGRELRPNRHKNQLITADQQYIAVNKCVR